MSTSCGEQVRSHGTTAAVERLESRRLLSADLSGSFVGNLPATLSPIRNNSVTVRIVNQGDAPAKGPVMVTLYASSDSTLDSGDTPLATINRGVRLKTGQGQTLTIAFATPARLSDGNDYLLGKISGAAVMGNVFASASTLAVKQPYVDLVTDFVYLPDTAIRTNGITSSHPWAAVRVVNIGNTVARGTVDLNLYMSATAVLDTTAARAVNWKPVHVILQPGQSRLFAGRIALPYGSLPGSYTLFGVARRRHGITVRHGDDLVAAGAEAVTVIGTVPQATLLGNYHRHHRHCIFYDGDDYCADALVTYGLNDAVVEGETVPPDSAPNGPTTQPSTEPSTQPSTQPSDDDWDSGLPDAMAAVAAQQSASGVVDAPGSDFGDDSGGGGGGTSGGGGDSTGGDFGGGGTGGGSGDTGGGSDSTGGDFGGGGDSGGGDSGGGGDDGGGDDSGGDGGAGGGDDGGEGDDIARRGIASITKESRGEHKAPGSKSTSLLSSSSSARHLTSRRSSGVIVTSH